MSSNSNDDLKAAAWEYLFFVFVVAAVGGSALAFLYHYVR